jgi:hypothetical protein
VANLEVTNQQQQIDNAQAEDDLMHSKFTNQDLYVWMSGQLSTTYFQTYQLAFALAKQAEQTHRYELGLGTSSYINFGYWDSLHKGLLAGEALALDLRRLEKAHFDQNLREYEITKHVSLAQLDPSALHLLRTKRECWINLPEELFDMDYPGHYLRRTRSLAMTMPCVGGPFTMISCTLTMTRNTMRTSNASGDPSKYPRKTTGGATDPRFRDAAGAIQSIAISTAQNDDGLFEMSFRDERYLPFEGSGAISQWHLQLPAPYPQFDYSTIADVVLHLKYTARDGGAGLASDAATSLATRRNQMLVSLKDTGLSRMYSAKHEFPNEWYSFLHPAKATDDQVLTLGLTADRFPYFATMGTIKITKIELVADAASGVASIPGLQVAPAPLNTPLDITADGYYAPMLRLVLDYSSGAAKKPPGTFTVKNIVAKPRITDAQLNDLFVIVHFEVT